MSLTVPAVWPHDVLTLCIDVGGSGIKGAVVDPGGSMVTDRVKVTTPYPCPPDVLVDQLVQISSGFSGYHRVSVGFPGLVRGGVVLEVPALSRRKFAGRQDPELAGQWSGFHLATALAHGFDAPVRVANDADMQGAAVVQGHGLEFVITLGTGVGTALFEDGRVLPHFELSHGPFMSGQSIDIALGEASRKAIGKKNWIKRVREAIAIFDAMLFYDHLYVGGGNARHLSPADVGHKGQIVPNSAGILGGVRIWDLTGPA